MRDGFCASLIRTVEPGQWKCVASDAKSLRASAHRSLKNPSEPTGVRKSLRLNAERPGIGNSLRLGVSLFRSLVSANSFS